jgi:hypothetical protein
MNTNFKKNFFIRFSIESSVNFLSKYFGSYLFICVLEYLISNFFNIKCAIFFQNDRFGDLLKVGDYLNIVDCWKAFNPYKLFGINFLPPFTIIIYTFFLGIYKPFLNLIQPGNFYLLLVILTYLIIWFNVKRSALPKHYFLFLFSFPILFTIERGNFAFFVFISVFLFIYFRKIEFVSMLFLAIAVSIKITPFIFVLLLFHGKNLKNGVYLLFKFLSILSILNFTSILFVNNFYKSNIYSASNFFGAQKIYEDIMITKFGGINFCSSFFMPLYYFFQIKAVKNQYTDSLMSYNPYLIVFLIGLIIFVFAYLKFKNSVISIWGNYFLKLEVLCLIIILFSPISADYYLSFALIPLLNYDSFKISSKRMLLYLFLFLPKLFFFKGITISTIINPLLIIILLFFILIEFNKAPLATR